jgi:hypothetical protein
MSAQTVPQPIKYEIPWNDLGNSESEHKLLVVCETCPAYCEECFLGRDDLCKHEKAYQIVEKLAPGHVCVWYHLYVRAYSHWRAPVGIKCTTPIPNL